MTDILFEVLQMLYATLVPLAIGSTVALILAISNEWATRSDRRDDYKPLTRAGVRLAYLLLFLDLYWNGSLIIRAATFGALDTDNELILIRSITSLLGTVFGYGLIVVVALALIKFCEDGKHITEERRAEWRKRRQAELDMQSRRRDR